MREPDIAERCKPFTEGFATIFGDIDVKLFGRRFHIGKCSLDATIWQGGEYAYSIAVGPITLPEVVDRPQFVLRAGPNEVTVVELHRWAGSLKSEIPRIIADNLAADLNVKRVAAYPQNAGDNADYRVLVDIQRFDSTMGESVTIDALWTVKRASDGGKNA